MMILFIDKLQRVISDNLGMPLGSPESLQEK